MGYENLETFSTDNLFLKFMVRACQGRVSELMAVVDEMCRVERAGSCPDLLPDIKSFHSFRNVSSDVLEMIQDRIDQYNSYVKRIPS